MNAVQKHECVLYTTAEHLRKNLEYVLSDLAVYTVISNLKSVNKLLSSRYSSYKLQLNLT